MLLPSPPPLTHLETISPTVYDAALHCFARASWVASGDPSLVPPHPRALLGIGWHALLERTARAGLPGDSDVERLEEAGRIFDAEMAEPFDRAHVLVREKFGTKERLPFYSLYRARAARIALDIHPRSSRTAQESGTGVQPRGRAVELLLATRDGHIRGRPDLVDAEAEAVLDYKSGSRSDLREPTDSEVRQLRLYAHLARENGIPIRKGVIERGNRVRHELPISDEAAADEGRSARQILVELNRHSGRPFREAAAPSPTACRFCPCIPFCPAFWDAAAPEWEDECGAQIEGTVESAEGDAIVSLEIDISQGTATRGRAIVTRLGRNWLMAGERDVPQAGETVRVTDARTASGSSSRREFRADRDTTAVWTVASSSSAP